LALLIVVVSDQAIRLMHDTDASDSTKHLVEFGVGETELSTAFHDLDDLLRYYHSGAFALPRLIRGSAGQV